MNDACADSFFAHIRSWQDAYRQGDGRRGNLLAPRTIRDHHDDFRRIVFDHEPDPIDNNAVEALLDPEYVRGMRVYDEAASRWPMTSGGVTTCGRMMEMVVESSRCPRFCRTRERLDRMGDRIPSL